ncbi:unnamed protein product [Plutella xylostella]|uniref:(diamondback moth) hypothetical protein n=1 Tax=Plutella xylostella TaxID=51655 RepID=A0A8S4FNH0_PLUXY|nr:unnamed protein product [Plutella xylostella]
MFNYNALSENEFQRQYRLSTNTFRFLCEELREITPLRASTRMTLEHKVCDSDCRITNINPKYGGATHDCFVLSNSQVSTGDSGYPQRLMTPINDAADDSPEAKYNHLHLHGKARVLIENTFGRLKNRWRCLNKDRTLHSLHYAPEKCAKIITACAVLHNIAIDFMVPLLEQDDTDALIVETVPQEEMPNSSLRESSAEDLVRGRAYRSTLVDRLNRLQR